MGYMGLAEPLDTIWPNGQKVTVYPDGTIVDRESNASINMYGRVPTTEQLPVDNTKLIIGLVCIASLVAMVTVVAIVKR